MRAVLVLIGAAFTALFAQPLAAKPHTFRDCRNCPEMVTIPAGHFRMGSAADEKGRYALEGPQHDVRIRRFAIGKYDITRGQWRAFVAATRRPTVSGCQWVGPTRDHEKTASWRKLDFAQDDVHPVVCITWFDARDYAAWLSRRTGHHYRLPSEAEWEYAARGGTSTAYWWGPGASHEFANHGTEECCGGLAVGRDRWRFTSPVGAFPANPFGLHDMGGNVLQYLADCFAPEYSAAATDGSPNLRAVKLQTSGDLADLNGANSCDYRVVRGGDWADQTSWLRSAARSFAPPPGPGPALAAYRSGGVGFRVARDVP
jgi:formylglycine-generating enzyme required for sulfatase activity